MSIRFPFCPKFPGKERLLSRKLLEVELTGSDGAGGDSHSGNVQSGSDL